MNRRTVELETPAMSRLRQEIKRLRDEAQLSQRKLAARIGYTRQYVSSAERLNTLPSIDLVRALDNSLAAEGHLLTLWREAAAERQTLRTTQTSTPAIEDALVGIAQPSQSPSGETALQTPSGRFFTGSTTPTIVVPAAHDHGRVLVGPDDALTAQTLGTARRALVVGVVNTQDGPRFYGMDNRLVRSRLATSTEDAPLLIPPAYRLDEFTLAIAWAVTNLDDALLDDDTELDEAATRAHSLMTQPRSALNPEHTADLSAVSRMWLGSNFCARHILRHSDQLTSVPEFWTREQRGEEASTWLLFAHKYQYLHRTAALFTRSNIRPARTFCIPPKAVDESWTPERILLLLAAALIESVSIQIQVCTEPEYSAVQGFVLDHTRRAIIANWINTDRVWQVDLTDHRPTVREFREASGWARQHSIATADTPYRRLRLFADYLRLDWTWLIGRATELADHGISGFTTPRSRLLSPIGLDRACQFLADEHNRNR